MLTTVDRRMALGTSTSVPVLLMMGTATAGALFLLGLPAESLRPADLGIFALAAALMNLWTLQMPGCGAITIVDALYLGALPVLGPSWTIAIATLAALIRSVHTVGDTHEMLCAEDRHNTMSAGIWVAIIESWRILQAVCTVALAGLVYAAAAPLMPQAVALLLGAVVMAVAQATLSAILRAKREGVRFYVGMVAQRQIAVYLLVLAPLGLLIGTLWHVAPLGVLFLLLPMAMMYRSLKSYTEVLGEARATIEDLALAVEKRDPCMVGHATRVSQLSRAMARELRLVEEDVETIVTAGRLHDLGKIAVPDTILLKADGLDEDELTEVKAHASAGSKVVERCSLVQRQGDVASLIRQHHERFDGRGYPDGLCGEEIAIGARILAVAEAWDTMTTPRTWRAVLTRKQAFDRMLAGRGTQFDPRVVNALAAVIKSKEGHTAP